MFQPQQTAMELTIALPKSQKHEQTNDVCVNLHFGLVCYAKIVNTNCSQKTLVKFLSPSSNMSGGHPVRVRPPELRRSRVQVPACLWVTV